MKKETVQERLRKYAAGEKEKLNGLTGIQKITYILDYYWLWLLGIFCAVFLLVYLTVHFFFTPKEYWFYIIFANTMEEAGNHSPLWEDYAAWCGYDTNAKKLEMNGSSYFDPSVSQGTNNSYFQSFVAVTEAGDLDAVVMGKDALAALGKGGRLLDLNDERCSGWTGRYEDRFVYCEPYDETYSDSPVPVGIDISDSILVTEYHLYPPDCALGIGAYTKRPDETGQFLRFIFGEER